MGSIYKEMFIECLADVPLTLIPDDTLELKSPVECGTLSLSHTHTQKQIHISKHTHACVDWNGKTQQYWVILSDYY